MQEKKQSNHAYQGYTTAKGDYIVIINKYKMQATSNIDIYDEFY